MKRKIILVSFLLILASLLSSCAGTLVPKDGGIYNKKEDIKYSYAPMCYEAAGWEIEVYIKDNAGFEYHKVADAKGNVADSSDFLYDNENKTLIYNSGLTIPSLAELDADEIHFYVESSASIKLLGDDDKETVLMVVESCLTAPICKYPSRDSDEFYKIKFYSYKNPYILYCLTYVEYDSDYFEYDNVASLDGYTFREGVEYEIINEADGTFTVKYNYGKYFVYNRENGECRTAKIIHDIYNPD